MAFPDDVLGIVVELQLAGVWTVNSDVRGEAGIVISRGRRNEASAIEPGRCSLTLDNRSNRYTLRNPASDLYGVLGRNTPLRVSVLSPDGVLHRRFVGEVAEWPQRWEHAGMDVWVPIEVYGLLRRLRASSPPERDAMRRFVHASGRALAYWPMTDGANARYASEAVADGPPLRALGPSKSLFQGQPEWSSGTLAPWLEQVAQLPQGKTAGTLTGSAPFADTRGWSFDHARAGTGRQEDLYLRDAGEGTNASPTVEWQLDFDATTAVNALSIYIRVISDAGSAVSLVTTIAAPGIFDADPHHIRLTVADDGAAGTNWTLYIDGVTAASGNRAGVATKALSTITYKWAAENTSETSEPISLGHLTYWPTNAPDAPSTYRALLGHDRERAGRRIERLCAEDGVALAVHGDLDDTPPMGPQRPGSLLTLADACVAVDSGTLGESREELALEYRTGRSRYNQGGTA